MEREFKEVVLLETVSEARGIRGPLVFERQKKMDNWLWFWGTRNLRAYTSWLHSLKIIRIRFTTTHLYVLFAEQLYCLTIFFKLTSCSIETAFRLLNSLGQVSWIFLVPRSSPGLNKLHWQLFTTWLRSDTSSHKSDWPITSGTGILREKATAPHYSHKVQA